MTSVEVKKVLTTLLRDPENNRCGDCKVATHPRWASWSLGVFVCIKCAGFHRSMGTHISKVKSVDLDTWTEEHLEAVLEFGNNKKFNEYYENKLGGGTYVPDQSKIGQFIRTKYELKKWVGDDPIVDVKSSKHTAEAKDRVAQKAAAVRNSPSSDSPRSLDLDLGLNLNSVVTDKNVPQISSEKPSATNTNVYRPPDRPDLKKSILSLYANRKSTSPHSQSQSPSQSSLHLPTKNMSTSNSLSSGGKLTSNPWAVPRAVDDSRSGSSLSLDDDLFKNVWS
ncbi:GTPase-activating protein AGE2 [Kluyveromyces lactis]|uniref:KLLA0F27555p n=1 Tax=Kluyveromyces lactis (strain ATCC 8585 / CBS 2359 / DSM 70799 / NBRC 1267 / NRRL Y-1140 / WM37) TaxID=284590 RepID=Q6CID3_KLULA|nr:uncharacterized protein KLLA0_F27555g [Kluyveromyces lactis]CAG99014.1 KLLA0F27555p [Kluyveromyces lactis]|eukprot:XP_456306.1 uncharacterized protein KLLA0_F27555g [Kluyveromyces lactis]